MTKLVKEINHKLQDKIYESRKYSTNLRFESKFSVGKKENHFKEDALEEAELVKQKAIDTILKGNKTRSSSR